MKKLNIGIIFGYMINNKGLIFPTSPPVESIISVFDFEIDQAAWESDKDGKWSWNPFSLGGNYPPHDFDPNASPKPTWVELVEVQEEFDAIEELEASSFRFNDDDQAQFAKHGAKARVAFCECAIDDIHIGSGITNMTGLIHHVDSANLAGENLPPVHMRSKKGKLKTYLTQKEMRKVLADVAERENIVESAHNALLVKFEETKAIYDDATTPAKERLETRDLLRKMVRVSTDPATEIDTDNPRFYQDFLQIEIDAYNPDILPTKVKDLKNVFIERLEGVATAKLAKIKNAATQHGVDLPVSCVDQQGGVTEVSANKQKGHIDILRAKTKKEVAKAFETWCERINNVQILNSPEWWIDNLPARATTKENPIVLKDIPKTGPVSITIRANHPTGVDIDSNIVITVDSEEWSMGKSAPFTKKEKPVDKAYEITYEISRDYTGTIDIELTAMNLCGPSKLFVKWKP